VTNMQKIVSFIPNLFTLGNLFCGCLAIIYAFNWQLDWAAYMVFLAAFLDFFDGFFARLLKVDGELGKQLDSLADMVSFGVVPGIVIYQVLSVTEIAVHDTFFVLHDFFYIKYLALIIPIFSCYRLAKFNIDTRQSNGFLGLPTPANAIFFCSIPLIFILNGFYFSGTHNGYTLTKTELAIMAEVIFASPLILLLNVYVLSALCVIFSLLLVSNIPLFALKFKNFGWADNKVRYIFLALCAVLLILFQFIAIPFIVILYILTSIVNNIFKLTV